jgi:hypothetical protein
MKLLEKWEKNGKKMEKMEKNGKKIIKKNQIDFFIILIKWISDSITVYKNVSNRFFPYLRHER